MMLPTSCPRLLSSPSFSRWKHQTIRKWIHPSKRNITNRTTIHDAIIIGGGPTGLLLSNLLSSYNIHSHLLFDKRPVEELLKHPQAHFINVRSMEILKAEVPNVYGGILREMPDVSEWEGFHFGGSVLLENNHDNPTGNNHSFGGRRLGRVVHPVREPLRVGQCGDAILVPKTNDDDLLDGSATIATTNNCDAPHASLCRPAHLAQNKFVSLLLQEARRHFDEEDNIMDTDNDNRTSNHHLCYGEEVVSISEQSSPNNIISGDAGNQQPFITIQTSQGHSYHTRYLLAADGVSSFTRKHFGIPMMGDSCMQNLINVHFRTNGSLSKLLMQRSSSSCHNHSQAMLHFVYNSQLVGVFVCHDGSNGEWVLQIPFFPPFQTMKDFDVNTVKDMIWAGLLGVHPPPQSKTRQSSDHDYNLDILSIRPWTMSSLVAQRYLNDSKNVMLVGDAAHAFPPAGGFGMNTGLQDAHNIAWRLALLLNREENNDRKLEYNDDGLSNDEEHDSSASLPTTATSFSNAVLAKYDQERRPIATQNAALSVRNYQRTLRIAKSCYLDAQHPQLLISMLNSPPMSLLPMEARQDIFRRLVRVAMMPLGSLISSQNSGGRSLHADHIEQNVRSILENGGSLPLVFPRYELGFSYSPNDTTYENDIQNKESGDTAGYVPRLEIGHRMPHVLVELLSLSDSKDGKGCAVMETLNHHQPGSNNAADAAPASTIHVSLTDISSQLRRAQSYPSPLFTVLAYGPALTNSTSLVREAVNCVMKRWSVPLVLVNVLSPESDVNEHRVEVISTIESDGFNTEHVVDTHQALLQLLHGGQAKQHMANDSSTNERYFATNALIVVRPDGHIANISRIKEREGGEKMAEQIEQVVEEGFLNSIGDVLFED